MCQKWHVKNPLFFDKSLRVVIEHKGNTFYADNSLATEYSDRPLDFYSSVAFWYQLGMAKQFSQWPSAEERVPQYALIQLNETLAENLPPNVTAMNERQFTNGKGLAFDPGNEGERASVDLSFEVAHEENYLVFGVGHFAASAIHLSIREDDGPRSVNLPLTITSETLTCI